jgi:hypothetical protein
MSLVAFTSYAQYIYVNLSYKVVLNPADGTRPGNITDAAIDQAITKMNQLQGPYFRGFRFRRMDTVSEVGGMGDTTGPSKWYSTDFFDQNNGAKWETQMESAAKADAAYHWNSAAVNIYVTMGICGGICSFPGHDIIIVGGCSFSQDGSVEMHEIGHYFNLCHTQGCTCGDCDSSKTGTCYTVPGDDDVSDTLLDLQCWNQDQIAMANFNGRVYALLASSEQDQVNAVYFNIMSYHNKTSTGQNTFRLTERQLDRWTDAANAARLTVTTGRTWYVNGGGTVQTALSSANQSGGDIILIRPGAYNEHVSIRHPVTLRVTRAGPAIIGTPAAPAPVPLPQQPVPSAARDSIEVVGDGIPGRLGFAGGRQTSD